MNIASPKEKNLYQKDYIRIITEEYANARLSGPEDLLRLAQRKKQMEHGG